MLQKGVQQEQRVLLNSRLDVGHRTPEERQQNIEEGKHVLLAGGGEQQPQGFVAISPNISFDVDGNTGDRFDGRTQVIVRHLGGQFSEDFSQTSEAFTFGRRIGVLQFCKAVLSEANYSD